MDGKHPHRTDRHDRHRRRTGRPVGRLPPRAARAAVRDPRRRRADRRPLAGPLGLAPALQPGALRLAPRHALPRTVVPLADGSRDGRLPRGLRPTVRPARPEWHARRSSRADRRRLRRVDRRRRASRRTPGHRRDRPVPGAQRPGVRHRARPVDPAAALARVPQRGPAQRGPRPRRRPVALRRRHRVRGRQRRPPDDPLRQVAWPDADPGHRFEAGHARLAGRRVRVRARAHDAYADGAPDAPGDPQGRRPAPSRSALATWTGPASSVTTRRPSARGTAVRCSPTARCSTWPTSSGPPATGPTTRSSRRRSSATTAGRSSSVASARRCRACTSSASRSSTPSPRCSWRARAATRVRRRPGRGAGQGDAMSSGRACGTAVAR